MILNRILLTIILLLTAIVNLSGESPQEILTKVDDLIKEEVTLWCKDKISYPPEKVVIRVFKKEKETEIWSADSSSDALILIKTLPVCAIDSEPGPKLRQGDGKTPEGFYYGSFGYYSTYFWMWMNLERDEVEKPGVVGEGSCFKICLDYPNRLDRNRSSKHGYNNPGSGICLHGNCVTAGCVSYENPDFLPVFAFARHHDEEKYGKIQVHIFPFRFENYNQEQRKNLAQEYLHSAKFNESSLLDFWSGLEVGYALFNRSPDPIIINTNGRVLKSGYYSYTVFMIKNWLKERELYSGALDNYHSIDFTEAIKKFQESNDLKADGIAGPQTLKKFCELGLNTDITYQFGM